ncbi:MAG: hypothetical protein R6U32_03755 [Candidatus Woesearchaeota archaeon]
MRTGEKNISIGTRVSMTGVIIALMMIACASLLAGCGSDTGNDSIVKGDVFVGNLSEDSNSSAGNHENSQDNGTDSSVESSDEGDAEGINDTSGGNSDGDDIDKLYVDDDSQEDAEGINDTGEGINDTSGGNTSGDTSAAGKLEVSFIDVGYGDSIFIRTPSNKTMLIDGGFNDKGQVVMKYLQDNGISTTIDVILATHCDKESIGGIDSVLYNLLNVGEVYYNGQEDDSQDFLAFEQFSRSKGNLNAIKEDTTINLDDNVKLQVIVPYIDGYLNSTDDNSLVLKLIYGDVSFLLMGDCGFACEERIMGHDLDADILKVAHFGADDSTSKELIEEVSPELAIISKGGYEDGEYPPADAEQRIIEESTNLLRTDRNGTIIVETGGESFEVTTLG